jgi:hypothetical protein
VCLERLPAERSRRPRGRPAPSDDGRWHQASCRSVMGCSWFPCCWLPAPP